MQKKNMYLRNKHPENRWWAIKIFALCLALVACNDGHSPDTDEDYATLFPFTGIDKPKLAEGEIVIRNGNTNITRNTFVYEGNDSALANNEYDVVLTYQFIDQNAYQSGSNRYVIRFVDANKQLVSISSNAATVFLPDDEYDAQNPPLSPRYEMKKGEEYTVRFKVKSGFQMLLCVTGMGYRNTAIKARITATATDGTIEPITLYSEQYQNSEGVVQLPTPYCKYVILP